MAHKEKMLLRAHQSFGHYLIGFFQSIARGSWAFAIIYLFTLFDFIFYLEVLGGKSGNVV